MRHSFVRYRGYPVGCPGIVYSCGIWRRRPCLRALPATSQLSESLHFELDALVLLNATDDFEEVAGVGVASRSEHAHQALGRLVRE